MILGESYFNPVDFFAYLFPWPARSYQEDMLLEDKEHICCASARGVGKSILIESDVLYTARHNPGKEGLITAPNAPHLKPLFEKILQRMYGSVLLRKSANRVIRSPEYFIQFRNGFKLHGRIAGTSGGQTLLGLHVDFLWVDEGQLYMPAATTQLQGCINPDCIMKIFGVPNGVRDSYLYKCTVDPDFKQYKIEKWKDPTWNEKIASRLRRIYGGENSQGWINQIRADWGSMAHLTFPERHWRKCLIEVADYDPLILEGPEVDLRIERLRLVNPPLNSVIELSGDAGYDPDPSIIGIWARRDGISTLIQKLILRKVSYSKQATFYNELAKFYNAGFVAVDAGGPGRSICLDLSDERLFPKKSYVPVAVNFGGRVKTAEDDQGKDITEKVKFFSTLKLQERFEDNTIKFSKNDLQIEIEVQESTQMKVSDGTYVYNENPDHNLAMMRAYAVAPWIIDASRVIKAVGNRPCFGTVEL